MLTRLAPTPSGYLHKGNIFNFLLNWLWARTNGGKVLLRIDDVDAERKRKEYTEDIFKVLDWLDMDWDIGPTGPDDFEKNWSQALRKDLYEELLNELIKKNMLFACTCSRKEQCHCEERNIRLQSPGGALKIKVATGTVIHFTDREKGYVNVNIDSPFVIRRKDGIAAYQLASLADDLYFKVSHIARGGDLAESTAMQLCIDRHLANPNFNNCGFWHHSLLHDKNGNKFSKSAGAQAKSIIGEIKKEALFSLFAGWMGIEKNHASLKSLLTSKALQDKFK